MALALSRSKNISLTNPSFYHLFSSSSYRPNGQFSEPNSNNSQPQQSHKDSASSSFSDIKATLKHQQQSQQLQHTQRPTIKNSSLSKPTSKIESIEKITASLSRFRLRSHVPPPPSSDPNAPQQVSFQELYRRNMMAKSENVGATNESSSSSSNDISNKPVSRVLTFDSIRESLQSLQQMRSKNSENVNNNRGGTTPMSSFMSSLRIKPANENRVAKSTVVGRTTELPENVFGKELNKDKRSADVSTSSEFVKTYTYSELGEKLRTLRPKVKGKDEGWFSLEELNERLRELRKMEEEKMATNTGFLGIPIADLRKSFIEVKKKNDEQEQKRAHQSLAVLGQLGTTPEFMLLPPKENLVEKYFHPDNMSSAEKLKIELAKVRDKFKMSESDCGSARVQVAQLTTKIKHLASVLHKKDKHSRRGLQAMMQERKKLLKYLRRTDWDSYCFVISKLGLQDNPSYKTKIKY
ncbi:hypothetical protein K2173_009676 [Erythroxylum novogranatense]|uniref:Small ribosomal subunit protein uS15c n=1 Tax=Erythroxylum novogranatense TaxID=1862640 RepID=A0AAV8U7D2_9ROSI|nr:hypothetical protein K2173_009676 [Erythroxylum novogranatense]